MKRIRILNFDANNHCNGRNGEDYDLRLCLEVEFCIDHGRQQFYRSFCDDTVSGSSIYLYLLRKFRRQLLRQPFMRDNARAESHDRTKSR